MVEHRLDLDLRRRARPRDGIEPGDAHGVDRGHARADPAARVHHRRAVRAARRQRAVPLRLRPGQRARLPGRRGGAGGGRPVPAQGRVDRAHRPGTRHGRHHAPVRPGHLARLVHARRAGLCLHPAGDHRPQGAAAGEPPARQADPHRREDEQGQLADRRRRLRRHRAARLRMVVGGLSSGGDHLREYNLGRLARAQGSDSRAD